jgi:hypothetical protein
MEMTGLRLSIYVNGDFSAELNAVHYLSHPENSGSHVFGVCSVCCTALTKLGRHWPRLSGPWVTGIGWPNGPTTYFVGLPP